MAERHTHKTIALGSSDFILAGGDRGCAVNIIFLLLKSEYFDPVRRAEREDSIGLDFKLKGLVLVSQPGGKSSDSFLQVCLRPVGIRIKRIDWPC